MTTSSLPREAMAEPSETRNLVDRDHGPGKIADIIDQAGFGLYQVHVFILSAGFILAEGSELQMASGLSNAIIDEFHITSSLGRSMLMTCTFLGFAAGTFASGPLGDLYGRRIPMLCGYLGVVCTAAVTAFAPTVMCIYVLRFVLGVFGGVGIPTALITISEVSPRRLRGMSTAALGVAYCLGDLWAAAGLWLVLPELQGGPWRILLFWAVLPATLLIIFGLLSPVSRFDTPCFLEAKGRHAEAAEAVRLLAELNGRPDLALSVPRPEGAFAIHGGAAPTAASDFWRDATAMLQWPLCLHAAVLGLLFFAKDFGYYGMGVFWPLAWAELDISPMLPAQDLMATALLGVPGVGIAMAMMYRMSRRLAIVISGLMCSVAALLIWQLERGYGRGVIGVLLFKLFFPTWQMVTMLLPCEIFPTKIRAMAYGCVAVMGRIATIISPTVVERSHHGFLVTCSVLGLLSACSAYILPETKDIELADAPSSPAAKKASEYGAA